MTQASAMLDTHPTNLGDNCRTSLRASSQSQLRGRATQPVGSLSRHTGLETDITRTVLRACTQYCKSCADECEQHAHLRQCAMCAHECRRCPRACQRLLPALG